MKLLSLSFAIILLISCVEKEKTQKTSVANNPMHGTWIASEKQVSVDGKVDWEVIKDGATFTLNSDGTFSSQLHDGCEKGTYTIEKNTITFMYNCKDFEKKFRYGYFMQKGDLVWTPKDILCVKGCLFKFRKG